MQKIAAQRRSRNRVARTLVTESVKVTKNTFYEMMNGKLIPDMRKWCHNGSKKILKTKLGLTTWMMTLSCMPSFISETTSPSFFHSIQSLKYCSIPKSIDHIIIAVKKDREKGLPWVLDLVWFSLPMVLSEIFEQEVTTDTNHLVFGRRERTARKNYLGNFASKRKCEQREKWLFRELRKWGRRGDLL